MPWCSKGHRHKWYSCSNRGMMFICQITRSPAYCTTSIEREKKKKKLMKLALPPNFFFFFSFREILRTLPTSPGGYTKYFNSSRGIMCVPEKPHMPTNSWTDCSTKRGDNVPSFVFFSSFFNTKMVTAEMKTVLVPASPVLGEDEIKVHDLHTSSKHNRQSALVSLRCLADRTKPAARKFNTSTHEEKKKKNGLLFQPKGISKGRKRHPLGHADAHMPDKCHFNFP